MCQKPFIAHHSEEKSKLWLLTWVGCGWLQYPKHHSAFKPSASNTQSGNRNDFTPYPKTGISLVHYTQKTINTKELDKQKECSKRGMRVVACMKVIKTNRNDSK
jgi:hypothetical protein